MLTLSAILTFLSVRLLRDFDGISSGAFRNAFSSGGFPCRQAHAPVHVYRPKLYSLLLLGG
jgi:hypothetical protein